jgi:hypothetical protein
LTHSRAT